MCKLHLCSQGTSTSQKYDIIMNFFFFPASNHVMSALHRKLPISSEKDGLIRGIKDTTMKMNKFLLLDATKN